MEQDQRAIHKLIILAILGQASGLTANQLMTLALETLYMDYFSFIQAYEELVRDHLITSAVRKDESQTDSAGQPLVRCDITPQGHTILQTLESRIPLPIRSYLASALSGWRRDQLRENTVTATVDPDADGFYQVRLRQHDGRKETVSMKLTVPNRAIAEAICANWRQVPQTLYLGLLSLLTEPHRDAALTDSGVKSEKGAQPSIEPDAFADRQLNLDMPPEFR